MIYCPYQLGLKCLILFITKWFLSIVCTPNKVKCYIRYINIEIHADICVFWEIMTKNNIVHHQFSDIYTKSVHLLHFVCTDSDGWFYLNLKTAVWDCSKAFQCPFVNKAHWSAKDYHRWKYNLKTSKVNSQYFHQQYRRTGITSSLAYLI